ncbi:hypothetical protein NDU88_003984 [Pleurodeles waltl]|uniref:Uncharacterized protein n=1 Tax=Pleurodeles waltl TaxID=8319 RepID=A0AAV7NKZ3_PLEWA|nr:hypothetical protein NDU88_003984 [Pleurodeles waltl]
MRWTSRRCRATRSARVVVASDGTLSMDGRRRERKEARRLVQSVTAEWSSRSGSHRVGTKPHMTAMLCSVMENLHLLDIWREMHPTFSCYTPTHGAYSRLDRFLLASDGTLDVRLIIKSDFCRIIPLFY